MALRTVGMWVELTVVTKAELTGCLRAERWETTKVGSTERNSAAQRAACSEPEPVDWRAVHWVASMERRWAVWSGAKRVELMGDQWAGWTAVWMAATTASWRADQTADRTEPSLAGRKAVQKVMPRAATRAAQTAVSLVCCWAEKLVVWTGGSWAAQSADPWAERSVEK